MAGYLKRLSDWQRDVTMKMMGVPVPKKDEKKPPMKKNEPKGGLLDPANRGGGMNRELMKRK